MLWGCPDDFVDVSKNRGTPKWMVYNGKPYLTMDDLGGKPLFSETSIYIYIYTPENYSNSSPPARRSKFAPKRNSHLEKHPVFHVRAVSFRDGICFNTCIVGRRKAFHQQNGWMKVNFPLFSRLVNSRSWPFTGNDPKWSLTFVV